MTPTKIYSHEELHKLDPVSIISHDGHRPMTVLEVVRHLIDGAWPDPDPETHRSRTQHEVMAAMATPEPTTQKPEQASQSEQRQ